MIIKIAKYLRDIIIFFGSCDNTCLCVLNAPNFRNFVDQGKHAVEDVKPTLTDIKIVSYESMIMKQY